MRYPSVILLVAMVLGVMVYSCSRDEAGTDPESLGFSPVAPFAGVGAPSSEALTDIDVALPEATGILAAGVGLRGDPGAVQPGTINFNVPGTVVHAFLYWEGMMSSAVPGDNELVVDGMTVTGILLGGPTILTGDVWTSSFRADITDKVSSGPNSLQISGMEEHSRESTPLS